MLIVVPRGAEQRAVRRGAPQAQLIEIRAGAAAALALPAVLDAPAFALVLGLCGGLRAEEVGTTVVYRSVADAAGDVPIDPSALALVRTALPDAPLVRACTVDHVVTRRQERRELAARFGADVVDMEGTHLARALRARRIAFAMVRVISDDARHHLPPIEAAFDVRGTLQTHVLAGGLARDPIAAVRFVRDVGRALAVLATTAAAFDG